MPTSIEEINAVLEDIPVNQPLIDAIVAESALATEQATQMELGEIAKKAKKLPTLEPIDYFSKPTFETAGISLFGHFLGVELELESIFQGQNTSDIVKRNQSVYQANQSLIKNDDKFCIIKNDGSLKNGFEICTRPASLDYHKQQWQSFFDNLPINITASDRCGMHVHISKEPLSTLQIGKMLYFINSQDNSSFISNIAGRGANHYSAINYGLKPKHVLPQHQESYFSHYSALNILNPNTVEIRIFKSTLEKSVFFRNLEFCYALVKFTSPGEANLGDAKSYQAFANFVGKNRKNFPYLVNFLVETNVLPSKVKVNKLEQVRINL